MSGSRDFVRGHPIAVFVVLAYLLSWTLVPFGGLFGSGPFVAAVVVLWVIHGRPGVVALLRRMVQWRVGWGWYAAAVLLPTGLAVLAAVLSVWAGATRPTEAEIGGWTEVPVTFVLVLLIPLFGPWEEPGFRGFALSRLMEDHSPLVAALAVAVIHVGFHVPLLLTGDVPAADIVLILAVGVFFAWLVIGSRGSVLLAMVAHATNNAVSGEYVSPMFSGSDADLLGWFRAGLWVVAALVLVLVAGRRLGAGPPGREVPRTDPSPVSRPLSRRPRSAAKGERREGSVDDGA